LYYFAKETLPTSFIYLLKLSMVMLKAIIFDLDNTLIDFMLMKRKSIDAAIEAMIKAGLKLDKEKATKILWRLLDEVGFEDPMIFQKFLVRVHGEIDWKILGYAIVAYRTAREQYMKPYPFTKQTLGWLKKKGFMLAIVTDAPKIKAYIRLASIDILNYFDTIITFDDTYSAKPHFLPFRRAMKTLEVKPKECLVVGDNPDRDIVGGTKMGMLTCLAAYGLVWKTAKSKVKPHYTIHKIEQLQDIVNEIVTGK
jgi:HAD superfamily hydrolase (TIGR02253 family)